MAKHGENEIEVKLRVAGRAAMLRRLAALGARPLRPRVYEYNTLYDTPGGALARGRRMLRLRVERPAPRERSPRGTPSSRREGPALLTYKGPARAGANPARLEARYKIRREYEVQLSDGRQAGRLLEAIGLRPWFRYEKYRSTYRLPGIAGLEVELDETPIGDFLELEGPPAAIDGAAAKLGYVPADYIAKSYGALALELLRGRGPRRKRARKHAPARTSAPKAARDRRPSFQVEPRPDSGLPDLLFRAKR